MLKHSYTMAAALLALASLPATAAGQISIGAGPSIPVGDFADEAVNGYHVQGSVGFGLPVLPFGLRADLFYQNHTNVDRAPGIDVTLGGEWFRTLGVMLNATYGLSLGALEPYALVGVGWVREWHGDRAYWPSSHSGLNLNAGVGLAVPVTGRLDLFVEARQLNLAGEELQLRAPAVNESVRFQSVPITFGVRF